MKNRLPVYVENKSLPLDESNKQVNKQGYSYGYVDVLFLSSIIITIASVLTVIVLGK